MLHLLRYPHVVFYFASISVLYSQALPSYYDTQQASKFYFYWFYGGFYILLLRSAACCLYLLIPFGLVQTQVLAANAGWTGNSLASPFDLFAMAASQSMPLIILYQGAFWEFKMAAPTSVGQSFGTYYFSFEESGHYVYELK